MNEEGKPEKDQYDVPDLAELEDILPRGKISREIAIALLEGATEEELVDKGYKKKTVQVVAWRLEQKKIRIRPPKEKPQGPETPKGKGGPLAVTSQPLPAKYATSPEALIETLDLPTDGQNVPLAEGIKVGMSMLVLGVRIAQELSSVGVQQARPLIAMAREMRQGEMAASEAASKKAVSEMADRMQDYLTPALNELGGMIAAQGEVAAKPAVSGPNPVRDMTVRIMEPILQNLINSMFPGMAGQAAPTGWKRVVRSASKEKEGVKDDDAGSTDDGSGASGHQ